MLLKVNGGSIKTGVTSGASAPKASPAPAPAPSTAPSGGDTTVQVTPIGYQLQQLENVLNNVSIVDSAHVDAIKRAISEGRFNVSSDAVADKLLETVRAHLLSPRA